MKYLNENDKWIMNLCSDTLVPFQALLNMSNNSLNYYFF
ncbi:hypothetical protein FBR4_3192 [Lactiplantibacillus plantarum]|nr:hypothetical protein FBR4_3192 [Lactiplantibacillus plantarum]